MILTQITLTVIALVVVVLLTAAFYNRRKFVKREVLKQERITLDRLVEHCKHRTVAILKDDSISGKSGEDWERAYKRQKALSEAARGCVYGIMKHKIVMKDLIVSFIKELLPDDETIDTFMNLNSNYLNPMVKFEILAYFLQKDPDIQDNVIGYLFNKYGCDQVKTDPKTGNFYYQWTTEELEEMFDTEIDFEIEYIDKLEIIATLVYEKFKGFGCIDTLRDLRIDGLNFGTSGSVQAEILNVDRDVPKASQSVWIYFRGKYIHAEFFDFYTEAEVKRVVQLLARYGNPGPLTEARGYIVNNMYDQSRVTAIRPPAAEYWAVFIRKFDLGEEMTLEKLINPVISNSAGQKAMDDNGNLKYKYKNAILPLNMLKYAMKGQTTTAFTGRQGSGKTTMMKYAIEYIDPRFTLRILEMTFEMYLREIYSSHRNILSVQETTTVTAQELQDVLKKSDAAVSIVGEVATDVIAARMIQMGQIASIFTIFSHHANRAQDLVIGITNSIVASSGGAATPQTVLPQVIDVIKLDCHLDYDTMGNRYIERITEIIPYESSLHYIDVDRGMSDRDLQYAKVHNELVKAKKQTEQKAFDTVDIIRFDYDSFTYVPVNPLSETLTAHILSRLPKDEKAGFIDFMLSNFKKGGNVNGNANNTHSANVISSGDGDSSVDGICSEENSESIES